MKNTCAHAHKLVNGEQCNCRMNDNVWREDSGVLTNKTHLPIKQLTFGDTDILRLIKAWVKNDFRLQCPPQQGSRNSRGLRE